MAIQDYEELHKKSQAYFERKLGMPWPHHRARAGVAGPVTKIG